MKEKLVDFLVCPTCGGPFKLNKTKVEEKEVMEGFLECANCPRKYPVKSGIPRIIPESMDKAKRDTAKNFGYEWKNFNQFYKEYQKQFEGWINPLNPDFFKGKVVFDAGCGKGRHVYYSIAFGAKEVIGVDLSDAVDVAFEQTKKFENAHIIQADIYSLPLRRDFFDLAYSIGVIHHLPDPKKGFSTVLQKVKPGGTILVWMYGKEGNTLLPILDFVRKNIALKMPLAIVKALSYIAMLCIHPVLLLVYKPLNEWNLTKGVSSFLPMNGFFHYLSGHSFTQNTSILFDQLIAPIANYYTRDEFDSFFTENNIKDVRIVHRNNNSWTGVGVR